MQLSIAEQASAKKADIRGECKEVNWPQVVEQRVKDAKVLRWSRHWLSTCRPRKPLGQV